MTLHAAIKEVLEKNKGSMTVKEIAEVINSEKLYTRKDGNPVPSSQIHARVKNYPSLFNKIDDRISIIQSESDDYKSIISVDWYLNKLEELLSKKSEVTDIERLLLVVEISIIFFKLRFEKEISNSTPNSRTDFVNTASSLTRTDQYKDCFKTVIEKESIFKDDFFFFHSMMFLNIEGINKDDFNYSMIKYLQNASVFGKYDSGQFVTPSFVNELLAGLAKPQKGWVVYDPAAGIGNTLVRISKIEDDIRIIRQDINPHIVELCKLNLALQNNAISHVSATNSLLYPEAS